MYAHYLARLKAAFWITNQTLTTLSGWVQTQHAPGAFVALLAASGLHRPLSICWCAPLHHWQGSPEVVSIVSDSVESVECIGFVKMGRWWQWWGSSFGFGCFGKSRTASYGPGQSSLSTSWSKASSLRVNQSSVKKVSWGWNANVEVVPEILESIKYWELMWLWICDSQWVRY